MKVVDIEGGGGGSAGKQRCTTERLKCLLILWTLVIFILISVVVALAQKSPQTILAGPSANADDDESGWRTRNPALYGSWELVIPIGTAAFGPYLGIQAVHLVLTPRGVVIIANGSSWRNKLNITQNYPDETLPKNHEGLFDEGQQPFEYSKLADYYDFVNNNGMYNPETNEFFRIPSPPDVADPTNSSWFVPFDLFCTAHMHLPDGNILFVGGTQYYKKFRTGHRATYIWDWKKDAKTNWSTTFWPTKPPTEDNPWVFSGLMKRGRWYPTIIPLVDKRMVVISGFVGVEPGYPRMYEFEMNSYVEVFDYSNVSISTSTSAELQAAWSAAVDLKNVKNCPFAVNLASPPSGAFDCAPDKRRCDDLKKEAFRLYPHSYLLPGGQIYITGDGDINSLRTDGGEYLRSSPNTYYLSVVGTGTRVNVSCSFGPQRPDMVPMSGTTLLDPNAPRILQFGGMEINGGVLFPSGILANESDNQYTKFANRYAGSRATRQMVSFDFPLPHGVQGAAGGKWTLESDFLGLLPEADRTMHYALILPTKEILIIGGGNYDYYGGVKYPLLLIPVVRNGKVSYKKRRLALSTIPRLYHSTAILLPDGRVLVAGGNPVRAAVNTSAPTYVSQGQGKQPQYNPNRVVTDYYFFSSSSVGRGPSESPAEVWQMELFSPPYLFKDGSRRTSIVSIMSSNLTENKNSTFEFEVEGKKYYRLHGEKVYTLVLTNLPKTCALGVEPSVVLMKLGSSTHGVDWGQRLLELPFTTVKVQQEQGQGARFTTPLFADTTPPTVPGCYMLFYVDCQQKPSVAQMVFLEM